MGTLLCFTLADHPLTRGLATTLDALRIPSSERDHVFYAAADAADLKGIRSVPERAGDPRTEKLLMALATPLVAALTSLVGLPPKLRLGYHAGGAWSDLAAACQAEGATIVRVDDALLATLPRRSTADAFDAVATALATRGFAATALANARAWVLEAEGVAPSRVLPRLQWQDVWSLVPLGDLRGDESAVRLITFLGCVGPKGTPDFGGAPSAESLDWSLAPLRQRKTERELLAAAGSAGNPSAHLLLVAACARLPELVSAGTFFDLVEAGRRAQYAAAIVATVCEEWLAEADAKTLSELELERAAGYFPAQAPRFARELERRRSEASAPRRSTTVFGVDSSGPFDARFRLCVLEAMREAGRFTTDDLRRHLEASWPKSLPPPGDPVPRGAAGDFIDALTVALSSYPVVDADWAAVTSLCPDGGDDIYLLVASYLGDDDISEDRRFDYESAVEAERCPALTRISLDGYLDAEARERDAPLIARLTASGVKVA